MLNQHGLFWVCVVLAVVNAALAIVAPSFELRENACLTAGVCGLAAFLFWVNTNKADE